ncbi:hypothetical protein DM2_2135 [Halorubrum sp. DM2]|nr:hypothetical protein DM2_2135 [Halorubrum sp. DM2]
MFFVKRWRQICVEEKLGEFCGLVISDRVLCRWNTGSLFRD